MAQDDHSAGLARPNVFVSHSSLDKDAVWPIVNALVSYAAVPWVDALELRPGDRLFTRISTAIEGTAYLLAIVSPNSVKSRWVEEEVRQAAAAEFYDGRIRVIPCALGDVEMPPFLKDRLYCDFSVDVMRGVSEVLRGIHRDRHVIELRLDSTNPLRLDETAARREITRVLGLTHGTQRFFFLLNAQHLLDELDTEWRRIPLQGDPLDSFVLGAVRDRAALPLVLPNLSCILSRASDVVVDVWGRDAGLVDILVSVIQRTTTLTLYRFWTNVLRSSEPDLVMRLASVSGEGLTKSMAAINAVADPGRHRSAEAFVFGCKLEDLIDLGFQGADSVFDSRVDVPSVALQEDTKSEYLGTYPLEPDTEIFAHPWVKYFVPVIAARHTFECAYSGQLIGHFLERIGLRKSDYHHFGLS